MVAEAPLQQGAGTFWLWPDNERTWGLWLAVQTQWVVGMSGPTGLAYAGVDVVLGHHAPLRQRRETFGELQVMERAALAAWDSQKDKP